MALTDDELAALQGYGRDPEKVRAEAKKLLAEAGVTDLKFKLINRSVNHPFTPVGVYVIDQWRRIGVTVEHQQLEVSLQKSAIANGQFQVALDAFCADSDDAKPLLVTYLSKARSPRNMARNNSPEIDALYDKFNAALNEADQKKIAGDLQRAIITEANSAPVIWYSRIVAHVPQLKGWKILPTHFANQDLTDVWLDQ